MVVLLAACGGSATPSAGTPSSSLVSFAVDSTDLGMQAFVATNEGMFAKHQINPVIRVFTYGVDGVDAMLTGQVNAAFACDFATLIRASSGHIKIVAVADQGTGPFAQLIVRQGINSGKDLVGKTMGVPLGTATQFNTLKYLESVGVATNQVKFVNFTSPFEMVTSMRAGRIDAAFLWGPSIDQGLSIPGTKSLIGDDKIPGGGSICLMVVDSAFLTSNRPAVERSIAALVEASNFIKTNPDKAAQDLATGIGAKKSDALNYMKIENFPMEITKADVQHLKDISAFQLQQNITKAPLDVDSVIDAAPLKAVAPANVQL